MKSRNECTCPCHGNIEIKHIMPCCTGLPAFVPVPAVTTPEIAKLVQVEEHGILDLDTIEAVARAANQEIWSNIGYTYHDDGSRTKDRLDGIVESPEPNKNFCIYDEGGHSEKDATHIACMSPRNTLALIARLRKAESELLRLKHKEKQNEKDTDRAVTLAVGGMLPSTPDVRPDGIQYGGFSDGEFNTSDTPV